MASGEREFEEQLEEAGNRLLQPPSSVDELLPLLDQVENFLSRVEQSPSKSMQTALSPSMKALVADELLRHPDVDVKVAVASCISEITRITAPDAPYDDDQMKDVFRLIVSSFENLSDKSSRSYSKRTLILETVAKVRSCVVMLDLECDGLIVEMFHHFLKAIRDYHPENVFSSMVTIMSLVLEESEDISFELISPILASVKKDNQEVLPIARKLGERVFKNCAIKVKPYLMQAMKSLGLSSDDYIKVISSICDGTNGAVGHNDDNACGEQLVTNSRGDFYHSADYSLAYSMRKMMSDKALNYNALGYDDKILDGFYDLYGILTESTSSRMPSLVDLQGVPMSDNISWEAIMVNRAADANLLKLEQKALEMAVKSRSESLNVVGSDVVRKLAALVSDYMGGSVGDPDTMLRAWKSLSYSLKATLGSMVLPLGSLTIGLPRHRALLFKVLADSVGIPCRLVKGQQYTGSDDAAMNFVKIDDGREYIVDLMADPGTLIPSDAAELHIEYDGSFFSTSPLSRDVDSSHLASSSSGFASSFEDHSDSGTLERRYKSRNLTVAGNESDDRGEYLPSANLIIPIKGEEGCEMSDDFRNLFSVKKELAREILSRPIYPYMHARFPSWTEGVSSPDVRRMKVKDVSQYMIDAAKENPQLAQKLHDVLLESGVVAPPNLFSEICSEQLDVSMVEAKPPTEGKEENRRNDETQKVKGRDDLNQPQFLPPLPYHGMHYKGSLCGQLEHQLDLREVTGKPVSSQHEVTPPNYVKNVPVAAAAAAAAVVASSMVVAVAKNNADSILELPVAAAATATAAAVVATTVAVSKQCENLETRAHLPSGAAVFISPMDGTSAGEANAAVYESRGSGDKEHDSSGANLEGERVSDRSEGNDRAKSDVTLDNVADCEIPWEDITLGERIGLGSYGEVYRGDWHGTEVAVKKFLDQSICGESLQEIKSEVRIMKRLRHPNVVLFMGAVTRAPNLSIITEFLPRGSLYRLIHRSNNQLDERRRLRMALDAARGMNYLHNCTPVIVHRDLKSPNLLVDRNWVVKVCDFGLSRMKHSTFLSSRSTAGTAEWMAPEVLRNEPSDEKCDVYSFGVILWELCTLQQPWGGMNPMQVVGAVGFQHRRLDIPDDMDPAIADIIQKCWQTDPKLRPSFAEIMAALKPLQKTLTTAQVPKSRGPMRSSQKSTPSHTP